MSQLQKITQWMRDAGQTVDVDNPRQASLYAGLCVEEGGVELMRDIGFPREARMLQGMSTHLRDGGAESAIAACDREQLLDDAIDLIWVATGLAVSLGADVEGALHEVILSNESKRFEDGKLRKDATGKVIKPSTYRAPKLAQYLPKEAS